ncbi:MAG: hypothetical protein R2939_08345 [Kofleriaceae bacterium]
MRSYCLVAATTVLAGCPRGAAPTSPSSSRPAADALRSLEDACRRGDQPAVLAHLADQGLGGGPKVTRAMRASDPMAASIVEDVCEPFPTELVVVATADTTDAGRTWSAVTITVDDAPVIYRFVDVSGAWLLGEVE